MAKVAAADVHHEELVACARAMLMPDDPSTPMEPRAPVWIESRSNAIFDPSREYTGKPSPTHRPAQGGLKLVKRPVGVNPIDQVRPLPAEHEDEVLTIRRPARVLGSKRGMGHLTQPAAVSAEREQLRHASNLGTEHDPSPRAPEKRQGGFPARQPARAETRAQ